MKVNIILRFPIILCVLLSAISMYAAETSQDISAIENRVRRALAVLPTTYSDMKIKEGKRIDELIAKHKKASQEEKKQIINELLELEKLYQTMHTQTLFKYN